MQQESFNRKAPLKFITILFTGDVPNRIRFGQGDFWVSGIWQGFVDLPTKTGEREDIICELCQQSFVDSFEYYVHAKSHEEGICQLHMCRKCGEICRNPEALQSHNKTHLGKGATAGEQHRQASRKNDSVLRRILFGERDDQHVCSESQDGEGSGPYTCRVCGVSFRLLNQLKEHGKLHSVTSPDTISGNTNAPGQCELVGHSSGSVSNDKTVESLQESETPSCCSASRFQSRDRGKATSEETCHTLDVVHACLSDTGTEGELESKQSEKKFDSDESRQMHVSSHPENQLSTCADCGEEIENAEKLQLHCETHTGDNREQDEFDGKLDEGNSDQPQKKEPKDTRTSGKKVLKKCSKQNSFQCKECGMSFERITQLIEHMRNYSGERPFACETCGKTFAVKRYLQEHRKKHSDRRPCRCPDCGKEFKSRSGLSNHKTVNHSNADATCEVCGKTFRSLYYLNRIHRRIHTGEEAYQCPDCGMKFSWRSTMMQHRKTHVEHRENHTEHREMLLSNRCVECGKEYSQVSDLIDHMNTHTEETPYCCKDCGAVFSNSCSLQRHRQVHINMHRCGDCGKTFSSRKNLESHMNVHSKTRPFQCQVCGRAFGQKANLNRHMKLHTGERRFSCEICGKTFIQAGDFAYHMRKHNGEKIYQCDRCGKSHYSVSKLTVHMRVHTGERPYKCSECGKAFKQSHCLVVHRRLHSGERPFSCQECHKTFTKKSNLQLHLKMHRGEKSHTCKHCGKGFVQSSNLKVHLRTHAVTSVDG